jgi:hypothetical protein
MQTTAIALIVMLLAGAASADILEWRDSSGVTHYTNLKDEIPDEQRDAAQVVVNELARHPQGAEHVADVAATVPEPRHQAQVIYDRSAVTQAYTEGLERGLEAARTSGTSGGTVQINGPLAVANAAAPPSYAYLPPYVPPLISTSFDGGRSRYLTLRMLLQDQFAIDREGPFAFDGMPLGGVPLSVGLNPFLPRGLPHRFPREARVITR